MLTVFLIFFIGLTFCGLKGLSFDILEILLLFLKQRGLKNIVDYFLYLIIRIRPLVAVVFINADTSDTVCVTICSQLLNSFYKQ